MNLFKPFKTLFLCLFASALLLLCGESSALARTENSGLGPLEVRTQYPVTMPFLSMHPENTKTVGKGKWFWSYRLDIGNTFVNTQGESAQISATEIDRGLTASDFQTTDNNTVQGYSLYLDVETYRHFFQVQYGLSDFMELSFGVPVISFNGGTLDSFIEGVHSGIGVSNAGKRGAFRSLSNKDQMDYYMVKDGTIVTQQTDSFDNLIGEFLMGYKWNLMEGGTFFPALTLKLSYKVASSSPSGAQSLVSSGGSDWGHYLILSKSFGDTIVYLGDGMSRLGNPGDFSNTLSHRFLSLEFRIADKHSLVLQTVSQTSIFPASNANPRASTESQEQRNSNLQTGTSVMMAGYKFWLGNLFTELSFTQDYINYGNETDFVISLKTGLEW